MFSPWCHVSWVFFARLAWTLGHIWRRAIYKNTLQHSSWWESSYECHHTQVNMPRIINLDACKIPRTFAGISFRILAIRQVMTMWNWPGPRPPSPWWLQGMAQTHDVLTHEILTVFTPEARKTRIILRAVTSFVSHDNCNGGYLWLVSDLTHWPLIGW